MRMASVNSDPQPDTLKTAAEDLAEIIKSADLVILHVGGHKAALGRDMQALIVEALKHLARDLCFNKSAL